MKRIGILRGGTDDNYETSLREGGDFLAFVADNLPDTYKPVDILVDRDGVWHYGGIPVLPSELMHRVDVVWSAAHPNFSQVLDSLSIPNIKAASVFNKNQQMLREHVERLGIKMPRSLVLPLYQIDFDGPKDRYILKKAKEVLGKFPPPWIVKSFTPNSNMGIHLAKTFPELIRAIEDGVAQEGSILVEEFIMGKATAVHSVSDYRGEDVYAFPIIIQKNLPHNFSHPEKERILSLAKDLHKELDAKHYFKCDFVLSKSGHVFLTGCDFSPNLRESSHFCDSCESIGVKAHHVIEHILNRASI